MKEDNPVKELDSLKVVTFTEDRIPNEYPGGDLPWQVYHSVRNALVRVCRRYGPTGPMGEVKIVEDVSDPYMQLAEDRDFWEQGDADPTYYIIPDQYNHERYCYAELFGDDPFNPGWLLSVSATLQEQKGWGLAIGNIPNSYVLIFGKKLMVKGRKLSGCKSASEVVEVVRRLLKTGDRRWWQFWK
jgi:hypothetical protein